MRATSRHPRRSAGFAVSCPEWPTGLSTNSVDDGGRRLCPAAEAFPLEPVSRLPVDTVASQRDLHAATTNAHCGGRCEAGPPVATLALAGSATADPRVVPVLPRVNRPDCVAGARAWGNLASALLPSRPKGLSAPVSRAQWLQPACEEFLRHREKTDDAARDPCSLVTPSTRSISGELSSFRTRSPSRARRRCWRPAWSCSRGRC